MPLAKALMLLSQLLGFLSSSFTLKSYAVHSAIRVFTSIVFLFANIILFRWSADTFEVEKV